MDSDKQKVINLLVDEEDRNEGYLEAAPFRKYLRGDYVTKRLGVTMKTLFTLAESGEFELGRISGVRHITTESFLKYLDRNHFKQRTNDSEPCAIDPRGRIKETLTYVGEPHTKVPKLYPLKIFAKDLGISERTLTRHCDIGTFRHYRIGSQYRMSVEDYDISLETVAKEGLKSPIIEKSNAGRKDKISKIMIDKKQRRDEARDENE